MVRIEGHAIDSMKFTAAARPEKPFEIPGLLAAAVPAWECGPLRNEAVRYMGGAPGQAVGREDLADREGSVEQENTWRTKLKE